MTVHRRALCNHTPLEWRGEGFESLPDVLSRAAVDLATIESAGAVLTLDWVDSADYRPNAGHANMDPVVTVYLPSDQLEDA